jgi:hypothetical protein
MRTPARRFEREEMVAYIHGIEPNGDIAHILVHKKGTSVRFSGRLGEHKVAVPNAEDLEHWVSEAESVWGLEAAIGVPKGYMNSPEILEKIELMNAKATAKKKGLEASTALSV